MARKKKKAAKKAPPPLAPKLRAVRSAIAKTLGDSRRAGMVSERAAKRGKGRLPEIPVVLPKDDPRRPEHFTVCIYKGTPKPGDLPIDVVKWSACIVKYGITEKIAVKLKIALLAGLSTAYVSNIVAGGITIYPLLESGRAIDDMRRVTLLASKASGVLN